MGYTAVMAADESASKKRRWLPGHTAAAAFVVVFAALAAGYLHNGAAGRYDADFAWTLPAIPAVAAALAGLFHRRRWYAWLDAFLFGVFAGALAGGELLTHPPFDGSYYVVMTSVGFFLGLFLFIGAVAELVRFLHRLLHRRPAKPQA